MKTTIFSQISIDGKLTLGAGNSSKELFSLLTSEDMEFIHKFRGKVDGIMVGRKTIATDNPFLTNRYEANRNPVRIVPSTTLDFPKNSNILCDNEKTIIATTEQAFSKKQADIVHRANKEYIICGKEALDFVKLFKYLEERNNVRSLMVEGGGQLNWSIVENDLADEIILMQLPVIIGGCENTTLVDGRGFKDISSIKRFRMEDVQLRKNYTLMRFVKERFAMQSRPVA